MVTLDVEVNPIVDVLYPAVVDGLNERVGVENGVSIHWRSERKDNSFV